MTDLLKIDGLFCIHADDEEVHYLRAHDYVGALREIRSHAVCDWGWSLPTQFNLCVDSPNGSFLVTSATLTDTGIVIR